MEKKGQEELLHIHLVRDASCPFIHHKHESEGFIALCRNLIFSDAALMASDLFIPLRGGKNPGVVMLAITDI